MPWWHMFLVIRGFADVMQGLLNHDRDPLYDIGGNHVHPNKARTQRHRATSVDPNLHVNELSSITNGMQT